MTEALDRLSGEDLTAIALAAADAIDDDDLDYYANDEDDLEFEMAGFEPAAPEANKVDGDTESVAEPEESELWVTSLRELKVRLHTVGTAVTLREAETRDGPGAAWVSASPTALGVTRAVVRGLPGASELSDGVVLNLSPKAWSFEDGFAVFETDLVRQVFSLAPAPVSTDPEDLKIAATGGQAAEREKAEAAVVEAREGLLAAIMSREAIADIAGGRVVYAFHEHNAAKMAATRQLLIEETRGGKVTDAEWRAERDIQDPKALRAESQANAAFAVRLAKDHEMMLAQMASGRVKPSSATEEMIESFENARRAVTGEAKVLRDRAERVRVAAEASAAEAND